MEKLEAFLGSKLLPLSQKLQQNKVLAALMEGFIRTSPITLGIALITIVGNFPIPGWIDYLTSLGIYPHVEAITNGATGVFSLYVVYSLAFSYAKQLGTNERNAAIISLASFVMLMPQTVATMAMQNGEAVDSTIAALRLDFLGGQGLFIGMIVALVVTQLYAYLSKKNIVLKLPDSVPPMVTQSLAPVVLWDSQCSFTRTIRAISMTMVVSNIAAFQKNEALPYLIPSVIYMGMYAAGFMGFMTFFMIRSKSAKMKQLGKLSVIPAIFNITEPLMFGMPIILNPLFFIPQVFTQLIAGFVTWGLTTTILPISLNPMISLLPWTTPTFVKMPLSGGINYIILMVICMGIGILMWYPFIKIADKKEYELELKAEAEAKEAKEKMAGVIAEEVQA